MNQLPKRWALAVAIAITTAASAPALAVDKAKGSPIFGDLQARHIGPALMSGRFGDIEGHPTNSRVLYAGAAGGGVWKTENGGTTWKNISDGYFGGSIGAVSVSRSNPDVIYVGQGEQTVRGNVSSGFEGMWKSTDGGVNFNIMPNNYNVFSLQNIYFRNKIRRKGSDQGRLKCHLRIGRGRGLPRSHRIRHGCDHAVTGRPSWIARKVVIIDLFESDKVFHGAVEPKRPSVYE